MQPCVLHAYQVNKAIGIHVPRYGFLFLVYRGRGVFYATLVVLKPARGLSFPALGEVNSPESYILIYVDFSRTHEQPAAGITQMNTGPYFLYLRFSRSVSLTPRFLIVLLVEL